MSTRLQMQTVRAAVTGRESISSLISKQFWAQARAWPLSTAPAQAVLSGASALQTQ